MAHTLYSYITHVCRRRTAQATSSLISTSIGVSFFLLFFETPHRRWMMIHNTPDECWIRETTQSLKNFCFLWLAVFQPTGDKSSQRALSLSLVVFQRQRCGGGERCCWVAGMKVKKKLRMFSLSYIASKARRYILYNYSTDDNQMYIPLNDRFLSILCLLWTLTKEVKREVFRWYVAATGSLLLLRFPSSCLFHSFSATDRRQIITCSAITIYVTIGAVHRRTILLSVVWTRLDI